MNGAPGDGGDLIEIAFQRWFYWPRRLLCFQKQLRRRENPLARLFGFRVAPGVVEQGGLAGGPVLLGEDIGHALALPGIDARGRSQVSHGDAWRDAAFAHLPLNGLRQCFHQRQTARDPRGATVEAARQLLDGAAQAAFHFREQPALFESRFRFAVHAQGTHKQERVAFAHLPNSGLGGVSAELLERGDALVSVDHQITRPLRDDDDGRLLAGLSQRAQ